MKAILKCKTEGGFSTERALVLARGAEIVCPEISRHRIVVERVRDDEGLMVLRLARQPKRPAATPAHFQLLEFTEVDGGVLVETDPVMVLPGRKNAFERDVPCVEEELG